MAGTVTGYDPDHGTWPVSPAPATTRSSLAEAGPARNESSGASPRLPEDVMPADYYFGGTPVHAEWGTGGARM